jgi:hypothetical protein
MSANSAAHSVTRSVAEGSAQARGPKALANASLHIRNITRNWASCGGKVPSIHRLSSSRAALA